MGYAKLGQKGSGIHLRQFSRAFVVSDNEKRLAFVSVDAGMIGHPVKREVRRTTMAFIFPERTPWKFNEFINISLLAFQVIRRLHKTYGNLYNFDNVVLSGTHTHGGPGGFLMDVLYDISILGFVPQTFAALVDGIYLVSLIRYKRFNSIGRNVAKSVSFVGVCEKHWVLCRTRLILQNIKKNYETEGQGKYLELDKTLFKPRSKARLSPTGTISFQSIVRAHETMDSGEIYIGTTTVLDASINRSPTSYLENPAEERKQYQYNVDKELTLIKFVSDKEGLIGAVSWFAVHPTSMNNSNQLVTSDNVGYASILLETEMNPGAMPGKVFNLKASANIRTLS